MSDTEPLDQFRSATKNANRHTPRGLKALADAMGEVGYVAPITAAADGEVLDGSARLETAFDKFGNEAIVIHHTGTKPIIMVRDDIPNAHTPAAKKISYGANRIAQLDLDFDPIQIAADLEAGIDLSGLWQPEELNAILEAAGTELIGGNGQGQDPGPQIDRAKELQEKWQTAPGQLWQLGRHRLICGDCTDRTVVERVTGGEKAQVCITDPPYNINEDYSNYKDNLDDSEYIKWCAVWFAICQDVSESVLLTPGTRNLYKWMTNFCEPTWIHCWYKSNATNRTGASWVNVWEPILRYGGKWRLFHDSLNYGIGMQSDTAGHPCPKSLEWGKWLINGSSDLGNVIFDPFLGSGTILIACENLGRACRAVEIDPGYCAVAIQRWVDLTGQSPQLLEG